ncbi:MAG: M66 family metalloprotease [Phycisphaerae bacterium]|nr:M66 family metalloprotease [Phycisphaerae bacterium]
MRNNFTQLALGALLSLGVSAASAATFRIEIDYMGDGGGHNHLPDQLVLDAVIQMFACQGHTLIIDLDDEIPHYNTLTGDPNDDCGSFWTYTGANNTYRSIRNIYRDQGVGWHYCIFAHQYRVDSNDIDDNSGCVTSGSSGRANGGDAFIVTLGGFGGSTGTLFEQAATLAHEFGHNLGLGHAGSMDSGITTPYVQNLPSVMAYTYQLSGVRSRLLNLAFAPEYALFKDIDFSHGRMCSLNENALDEPRGTRMLSVDFNCDDSPVSTGIAQDLGFRGGGSGSAAPWCGELDDSRTTLVDYDEWGNLNDGATLVANAERGEGESSAELAKRERLLDKQPCLDAETHFLMQAENDRGGGGPDLVIESCITGENCYVANSANAAPDGRCVDWYPAIAPAHNAMPQGSVFYLTPGTFDAVGTTTLNRRGIWTCNTGTARIQ